MLKKIMATAFLVCAIPAMASAAWFLSTQVMSGGGTISSANGPAQDYKSGAVFKSYSAADQGTQTVTFTPNTGYSLELLTSPNLGTPAANLQSYILLQQKTFNDATGNYTTATLPLTAVGSAGAYTTTFNPVQNSTVTIAVNYKVARCPVTATMNGGTVSPSAVGNITYGYKLQAPLYFYFSPAKNTQITQIGGLPVITAISPAASITYTDVNGATQTIASVAGTNILAPLPGVNQRVRVSFPKGYVFASTFVTLAGASSSPTGTLFAGLAKTITAGSAAITLTATGTLSSSPNVTWSYVSGPLNTASGTNPNGVGSNGTNIPTLIPKPDLVGNGSFNAQSFSPGVLNTTGQYLFKVSAPAANGVTSYNPTGLVISTVTVNVVPSLSQAAQNQCQFCHTANGIGAQANAPVTLYTNWSSSVHRANNVQCSGCHYQAATGGHPGALTCGTATCHTASTVYDSTPGSVCSKCHPGTDHKYFGLAGSAAPTDSDCVGCHDVAINHNNVMTGAGTGSTALVNDNSGVRAITGTLGEFDASARNNTAGYRSHHIYNGPGVDPQNAQCIVCHLEGKSGPGRTVAIDPAYHMHDATVHLRSGNLAISADVAWDPANPDHTGMDNFCMSCHNAAGAVSAFKNVSSALKGMTPISGSLPLSALNPFGDKLTNAYDQMVRPAVINVYDQFDPTNTSHHAVRGNKYTGRTRTTTAPRAVANAGVFTQYSGANMSDSHPNAKGVMTSYQIFGSYSSTKGSPSGDGPTFPGSRQTLYDAQLLVASYTTLNGSTLGDDSKLHCGDCHSVGQWKAGSANAIAWYNMSTASGGSHIVATTAVIGAHGSQNEYMLRTSNGTDALHRQSSTGLSTQNGVLPGYRTYTNGTYVCYLCHVQENYGDNANNVKPLNNGNAHSDNAGHGATGRGDCNGAKYTQTGKTGFARVNPVGSAAGMGNLFGYTCGHCHNSGEQIFGGIHGSSRPGVGTYLTYSTCGLDVAGSTLAPNDANKTAYQLNVVNRNSYRFMGGTGIRYNGGNNPAKWEAQSLNGNHREGCYNLSATTDTTHLWNTTQPLVNGSAAIQNNGGNDSAIGAGDYSSRTTQNSGTSGWGSCNHHQGSTTAGATTPTRGVQRPLVY